MAAPVGRRSPGYHHRPVSDLLADDPATPRTLPATWLARWAADPSAPVLALSGHGPRTPPRWLGGDELQERTSKAAAQLYRRGIGPGQRVLWLAERDAESVLFALGVLRLGAVLVPVNPSLTPRELGYLVHDVEPQAAVARGALAGVLEHDPWDGAVLDPSQGPFAPGANVAGDLLLDQARPGDPAVIIYTSGTTGAPKGAVLRHANLTAGTASLRQAWEWSAGDRLALALPLFHVHGLGVGLFGTLDAGASAVVLERFDPGQILAASQELGATMFFGVPTMYHRMAAAPDVGGLGGLRLCVSGSAPLPEGLWRTIEERSQVAILERYGMTETYLTMSNPYRGERRPGTVGFPLPAVTTTLAPAHHDQGEGELWVKGPTLFQGYWRRPAATAECFAQGWFTTGDVGALDPEGYLVLKGRAKELIISGGFNVYPAEVEDVLLGHPGVAEVAVAGLASDEWGEVVTAWVVPTERPLATEEVLAFAAQRLAGYKRPREIRVVDALPRNAMGKVQRQELRRSG